MTKQREKLKAKLLAEAEQAIEAMLSQLPETGDMSLREMEAAAGRLEQVLGQATVQTLLNEGNVQTSEAVMCPTCGSRMQRRGRRRKHLVTVRGEVDFERAYYLCPTCGNKRFPPG